MATEDGTTTSETKPVDEPAAPAIKQAPLPAQAPERNGAASFQKPPELAVAFRGYDRAQTDSFLQRLEESFHKLTSERDALKGKVDEAERKARDLEAELVQHRVRQQAVADALITAQTLAAEVRAAVEKELEGDRHTAATAKADALQDAAEIRAGAQKEAAELLRDARSRADSLIDDVQRGIRDQQHEAEHLLDDTKERLGSLVRDLLTRLGPDAGEDLAAPPAEGSTGSS